MHYTMVGTDPRRLIIPWQSLSVLAITEKILRRVLFQDTLGSLLYIEVDFLQSFGYLHKQ